MFKENLSKVASGFLTGSIFLSFYTYLFLIPFVVLLFTFVYLKFPEDFIVSTTDKGTYFQNAKFEFLHDLCKENPMRYDLEVNVNSCIFSYKINDPFYYQGKIRFKVKSIQVSFKEAIDKKIILRYSFDYSFHEEGKKSDAGVLELSFEHYNTQKEVILYRAVPYIPYPDGTPLIEIKSSFAASTKIAGPYKGLDFISIGILDLNSDNGSITIPSDWSWFSIKKNTTLEKGYKLFFEGKPVFDSFFKRFSLFFYFSGITLMTVGYGDITPITSFIRVLTVIESFFGVVFLGLLSGSFFAFVSNAFSRPWKEFERYLSDQENWTKSREPSTGIEILYYIPMPDYKIIFSDQSDEFSEVWATKFADKKAFASDVSVKYKDTILYNFRFIRCDGYRGISILPNTISKFKHEDGRLPMHQYFYIIKNSFNDKLNKLIQHHNDSGLIFQFNYFSSEKEANLEIEKSFSSGKDTLTCFVFSQPGVHQVLNRK